MHKAQGKKCHQVTRKQEGEEAAGSGGGRNAAEQSEDSELELVRRLLTRLNVTSNCKSQPIVTSEVFGD